MARRLRAQGCGQPPAAAARRCRRQAHGLDLGGLSGSSDVGPASGRARPQPGAHRLMDKAQERRSRLLGDGDINVSFEFFPPKTEKMEEALWAAIRRLEPLRPKFVSVTYGAGGSTRERTHNTVARLARETALVPAAHLTCVQATKAEVDEVARSYKQAGCRHLVA